MRDRLFCVFHADEIEPPGSVIITFWTREEAEHFAYEAWNGYGYSVVMIPFPEVGS